LFLAYVPEVGTLLLVLVGGAVPVVLMDQDDIEAEGLLAVALEAVLLVNALDPRDVFFCGASWLAHRSRRSRGRLNPGPSSASMAAPWLPRSRAHCFEPYLRGGGTTRERATSGELASSAVELRFIGSLIIEDWVSLKINRFRYMYDVSQSY
jgi:hypothetical protein